MSQPGSIIAVHPPPRFILGATLLFWGLMTDRLLIAVVLALMIEAAHWVRFRWDFDDEACGTAWQFTSIGIGVATVLIWLDGNRYTALPNLLTWLPALLLPMQFVQSYGLRQAIPLNTFSFLAKQRRRRNQRLGLTEAIIFINFGNIYFITGLISSTLGTRANVNEWSYLLGMLILIGWMLASVTRSRPLALCFALAIAGILSVTGQRGLQRAEEWISNSGNAGEMKFDPNSVLTLIGKKGTIQQSPEIVWRLKTIDGSPPPKLVRLASYNIYRSSTWENLRVAKLDFLDLDTLEVRDGEAYFILNPNFNPKTKLIAPDLPRYAMRGSATEETPLPLPGNASSLMEFSLVAIQRNTFGSVRVFPEESVIDGVILWNAGTNPESPPLPEEDLKIPLNERRMMRIIARDIGLLKENTSLEEKLAMLRGWFLENFEYTRTLNIYSPSSVNANPSAIAKFLTKERSGHCEYFATATTLLLRQAGIPARYTTGYAVSERDFKRDEFVIRGTHGHAWCSVWDESIGQWRDFDTTPPQWLGTATPPQTSMQRFEDGLKRLREDFFLWRNQPDIRIVAATVMSVFSLGVLGFIVRRLWRSKKRLESLEARNAYAGSIVRTPLHDLEPQARKHLGYRPQGQPFSEWLEMLRPSVTDHRLLENAIQIHQRLRFDPAPALPDEHEKLRGLVEQLKQALKGSRR